MPFGIQSLLILFALVCSQQGLAQKAHETKYVEIVKERSRKELLLEALNALSSDQLAPADVVERIQFIQEKMKSSGLNESDFNLKNGTLEQMRRKYAQKCYHSYKGAFGQPRDENSLSESTSELERWKSCAYILGMAQTQDFKDDYNFFKKKIDQTAPLRKSKCTTVDLESSIPAKGIRNQGDFSWCYAAAAADQVSYYAKAKISAADMALEYERRGHQEAKSQKGSSFVDIISGGGDSAKAIQDTEQIGFCLEENFRTDENGVKSLDSAYQALANHKIAGEISPSDLRSLWNIGRTIAPNMSYTDFVQIVRTSPSDDFFRRFRNQACAPRLKMKFQVEESQARYAPGDRIGNIIQFLYMINFSAEVRNQAANPTKTMKWIDETLERKDWIIFSTSTACLLPKSAQTETGYNDGHAVSLVGRKWNEEKKSCEYIIKNSWGPKWEQGGRHAVSKELLFKCVSRATRIAPQLPQETAPGSEAGGTD